MDPARDVIPSGARNLALVRSIMPQLQGQGEIPRSARNDTRTLAPSPEPQLLP